jgi:hypothetical protein
MSWGASVDGTATGYRQENWGVGVRVPVGSRIFLLSTSSRSHPASYPMGAGGSFPGGKAAGEWRWPLTSTSAEVKKMSIYISTPPYFFIMSFFHTEVVNSAVLHLFVFSKHVVRISARNKFHWFRSVSFRILERSLGGPRLYQNEFRCPCVIASASYGEEFSSNLFRICCLYWCFVFFSLLLFNDAISIEILWRQW